MSAICGRPPFVSSGFYVDGFVRARVALFTQALNAVLLLLLLMMPIGMRGRLCARARRDAFGPTADRVERIARPRYNAARRGGSSAAAMQASVRATTTQAELVASAFVRDSAALDGGAARGALEDDGRKLGRLCAMPQPMAAHDCAAARRRASRMRHLAVGCRGVVFEGSALAG